MMRRQALAGLRLVVSAGLIALLVSQIGGSALSSQLGALDPRFIGLAALFQLIGIALSAAKWRLFLAAEVGPVRYETLLRLYLVGSFFNNFLPSSIGGDAVRAWQTAREYGAGAAALRSIFLERLTGVAAIVALAAAAAPLLVPLLPTAQGSSAVSPPLIGLVAMLACAAMGLGLYAAAPRLAGRVRRIGAMPSNLRAPRLWCVTLALSLLFQLNAALIIWLVGRALGIDAGLDAVLLCTPLVSLLTMLPITINGIGVREGVFVGLYGLFGVAPAAALIWSLAVFVTVAAVSLPGGVLYALQPHLFRQEERPAP